jgi:hypothetical protein
MRDAIDHALFVDVPRDGVLLKLTARGVAQAGARAQS